MNNRSEIAGLSGAGSNRGLSPEESGVKVAQPPAGVAHTTTPIALMTFVAIYAYQFLNGFWTVSGPIGVFIDVFLFFLFPIGFLYQLSRVSPSFRATLIDGLRNRSIKNVSVSIFLGVLYGYLFMYLAAAFNDSANANSETGHLVYVLTHGGLLSVLYLSFSAAIVEEILYKTLLSQVITREISCVSFAVLSGVLFGAAHHEQGVILSMLTGLLFGAPTAYYYRLKNNLFGLIVLHFAADFMFFGSIWAWFYV